MSMVAESRDGFLLQLLLLGLSSQYRRPQDLKPWAGEKKKEQLRTEAGKQQDDY